MERRNKENIWIKNIGKFARIWYIDDLGSSREKSGLIADADDKFIILLNNLIRQGIKIDSITRFEIKEGIKE